jgi:O-antigen/teichoic acid export membrane protein
MDTAMSLLSILPAGQGLFARAARSSIWSLFGFATSQVVRLASNLILARLLFPEAFGLMALVTVLTIGVMMLSDVGIGLSISQSHRGDDENFLDTAWTLQVIRAILLGLILTAVGGPAAQIYDEPLLASFLPLSAVGVIISGFVPISFETAVRHMQIGRVTAVDLLSQITATLVMVLLAWTTSSVWSLIVGNVCGSIAKVILAILLIGGKRGRFLWEPAAARELIHFGKWIFASTVCGFLLSQGDRVILGAYVALDLLGIYNVAQFLATMPLLLASAVAQRVIIPLYRECMLEQSDAIRVRLIIARRFFTGATLLLQSVVALSAVMLIGWLYDDRYAAAGPIAILLSLVQLPLIVGMTYDRSALAVGDSRSYFYNLAARAILITALFVTGMELGGIPGALTGQLLAGIIGHSGFAWLAWKNRLWDPWHDIAFGTFSLVIGAVALWYNWFAIIELYALDAALMAI